MATKSISCSWVGSGTSSYSQYTSTIHINKNYRACASFSMSGIPAGSTVTSMKVTMVRSSNLYTSSQSISFAASTSKAWSYTSQGSGSATLSQSSGNTYTGSLSASLGNTMLSMGSGYLHLSSSASDDIIYSSISISVTYTEPVTTYTVTYQPGSYASGSTYTATKTAGTALTLRGSTYTRSGYTQTGWSTSSTGTSKTYNLSASYTTDAAITLYPYWTQNAATTYVVRYEPGDYAQGSNYSATKTQGVALTLRGQTYTRSGYIQTGWSTSSNGASKNYELSGSYTTNAAITLYPYWEFDGYLIQYDPGDYANETTVYNHNVSNSITSVELRGLTYTREGYVQAGWSYSSSGESKDYDLNGTYTDASSVVLYPYWGVEITSVTVIPSEITIREGESFTAEVIVEPSNATYRISRLSSRQLMQTSYSGNQATWKATEGYYGTFYNQCGFGVYDLNENATYHYIKVNVIPKGAIYYAEPGKTNYTQFVAHCPINGTWVRSEFRYSQNNEWIET